MSAFQCRPSSERPVLSTHQSRVAQRTLRHRHSAVRLVRRLRSAVLRACSGERAAATTARPEIAVNARLANIRMGIIGSATVCHAAFACRSSRRATTRTEPERSKYLAAYVCTSTDGCSIIISTPPIRHLLAQRHSACLTARVRAAQASHGSPGWLVAATSSTCSQAGCRWDS